MIGVRTQDTDASPLGPTASGSDRTCILVLGMHRSGTSALTRVLSMLGAALPSNLLGAGPRNETGHWEPARLIELHEQLLLDAGSSWDDWRKVDPEVDLPEGRLEHYRKEIRSLVEEEYGQAPVFVLKEPRICRLVPLYRDVLKDMGIVIKPVLIVRNPLSVAASLKQRDQMNSMLALYCWMRHVLDAETDTRDLPRAIISYEALLADWRSALKPVADLLGCEWQSRMDDAASQIDVFLTPTHQHHVTSAEQLASDEAVPRSIREAYAALTEMMDNVAGAVHELDAIGAAFDGETEQNARLLAEERVRSLTAERKRYQAAIAHLQELHKADTKKLGLQVEELTADLAEARSQRDSMKPQLAEALATASQVETLQDEVRQLKTLQDDIRRLEECLGQSRLETELLRESTSWRLTAPLRALKHAANRFRPPGTSPVQAMPPAGTVDPPRTNEPARTDAEAEDVCEPAGFTRFYPGKVTTPAFQTLTPSFLIIAELSLPQCRKYRVMQKREMLGALGYDATVIGWHEHERARDLLQTHSVAIFYRTPAAPSVLELIAEAKRLNVPTFWEVDDLIFDAEGYLANRNLDSLRPEDREGVLAGAPLYRDAMRACDEVIASTPALLEEMHRAGGTGGHVIMNALDEDTLRIAQTIRDEQHSAGPVDTSAQDAQITIVYGSGTKTHDADFLIASDALVDVLDSRPDVRLKIIGELNLPTAFDRFGERVETMPLCDFETYLRRLAQCDIAIAALEPSRFNDAKSNIKFLEAAVLGIPAVCSPSASFRDAIDDGENGFLAETRQEWREKLLKLVDDCALRRLMGKAADISARERFHASAIARSQIMPLLERFDPERDRRMRMLFVNVYYDPQRFGGATIVVEQLARSLTEGRDAEAFVFTSWPNAEAADYDLVRYDSNGVGVFAVKMPEHRDRTSEVEDKKMARAFERVLKAIRPDVVHLHAIQGFGTSIAGACRNADIPYTVTLHDAWWLCERQFMIRADERYCGLKAISPDACGDCVEDEVFSLYRDRVLRTVLDEAALLFAPSEFSRALHVASGLPAEKVILGKNGIRPPAAGFSRSSSGTIRFAYVGGKTPVKGYPLLLEAFSGVEDARYELIVVDNTLNLGIRSIFREDWHLKGRLRIEPAYTQDTLDDFFSGVDVLLFPTQVAESFGLTIREALARDVWVVTSDAGGAVEDIVDGENGTIIPFSGSAADWQNAIERLITQQDRLRGHRNRHKDRIHTFDRQAKSLLKSLKFAVKHWGSLCPRAASNVE